MGKYISIRGWFECEEHDVSNVKEICMDFTENYKDTELIITHVNCINQGGLSLKTK